MAESTKNKGKQELTELQTFDVMQTNSGFQIKPYTGRMDLEDTSRFIKLPLSSAQRIQVNAFLQQTPQAIAAGTLAKAYTVSFPEGLPHTLTSLRQGGYGSMIQSSGEFLGSASFYPITAQAAALGAFTAMSAVTGQYFLTQINSELKMQKSSSFFR